jgi:hypothetical protein
MTMPSERLQNPETNEEQDSKYLKEIKLIEK